MNIVFMGTPDFSVPILEALHENYNVVLVVTQPDKEVGRKKKLTPPPVKLMAEKLNIPVFQPRKIKKEYTTILEVNPDLIVTAAYGQIIPKIVLDYPTYGCINVHASLLPKLRGGAPIQRAIMRQHKETGVTIMYMSEKMDEGDIISQKSIPITKTDTSGSMFSKLSILGRDVLLETLPKIINGTNKRIPQNHNLATYAYNLKREEEKLNWNMTCNEIDAHIRALSPSPNCYTFIEGKRLKILQNKICDSIELSNHNATPGTILEIQKDAFKVATKNGFIWITKVQLEGKKPQTVEVFLQGAGRNLIQTNKTFQ
jgi:methionyl-tRNA formyltransferase